jgi:hypothetical protein
MKAQMLYDQRSEAATIMKLYVVLDITVQKGSYVWRLLQEDSSG